MDYLVSEPCFGIDCSPQSLFPGGMAAGISAFGVFAKGEELARIRASFGLVFQNFNLFPHMSVMQNITLAPTLTRGVSKEEAKQKALSLLERMGLADKAAAYPCELSGGQQQRVSIARGLAVQPDVLFMDEPFAALDAITRLKMQDDIHRIAEEEGVTVVFVTHDIEEAVALADRIVVLTPNPGRVKEIIKVELGPDRLRTADDFLAVRDHVFDVFGMKPNWNVEYVI